MVTLANEFVQVQVAPEVGGRIVSFVDRASGYDFVWRNANVPLRRETPGAPYDPNFFGGFDELLPNDIPESIAGIACPDHGEMWTADFEYELDNEHTLSLATTLPLVQFHVDRLIQVHHHDCRVTTTLTNKSHQSQPFLWKLHAALAIEPGDTISCDAKRFRVADPDWSRRTGEGPWQGETVPRCDKSTEFLYLDGLETGEMTWRRGGKSFSVRFDLNVFPYAWYFASYGGFDGHHVAILEPCTTMPMSVNAAHALGQCSVLEPGETLTTVYTYSGRVE